MTGSHNWSGSADTRNDENTLIFYDADIANIFLQEFEARWCEIFSGVNCTTFTEETSGIDGFKATLTPNPASGQTSIQMQIEGQRDVVISLWDFNGKMLQSSVLRNANGEVVEPLFLNGMPSGTYFVTFRVDDQIATRKLEVVR